MSSLSTTSAATAPRAARQDLTLLLMWASGFAGLGYQVVWTQQSGLWLGHESAAVLAVVAAFFGGLALGSLGLGARIEASHQPRLWYVACEALIGLWGLFLMAVMGPASQALLNLTGAQPAPLWQWSVAFGGTFVLLLPATAAMGATLPAIERLSASLHQQGRSIALLYACNTAGAVLGVLATAFWLVPALGLSRTAGLCVLLNLLCAAVAFVAWPKNADVAEPARPDPAAVATPTAQRQVLIQLALTGCLGIGYEVLVVRVLSQVTEDTVYTFAMLLAVYLIGTALGAAAWQRWLAHRNASNTSQHLLAALALMCLLGTASLWGAEDLKLALQAQAGGGMSAAIAVEALLALAAFGLPTLVMGALFSQLSAEAHQRGLSFGRALGVNTLGAALAPLLFGVWLAPALGPKGALLLIPLGYLALIAPTSWLKPWVWLPAGATVAVAALSPPLAFVDVPEGGRIVSYLEGGMAAVSVVEDGQGVSRLRINNRQQEGSSSSLAFDARQALLPVLLHPAPQRALFLGLGTGMTASSAAEDPTLQVDAVELLPEVIQASRHFTQQFGNGEPNPGLHLMAADARRYVRVSDQRYDVIVADNFHPARSGSGALYTVEHFGAVGARLAPGGLFCQWLPLHQLDLQTLRLIVQSFVQAYPEATALLANNSLETPVLGLVGRAAGTPGWSLNASRQRLSSARFPTPVAQFGIEDEYALLGSFVAGPQALKQFAGDVPANTDDLPLVSYRAPRITYAPDSTPRDRLLSLLQALTLQTQEVLSPEHTPQEAARLSAYWAARQQFINAGRQVRPSRDVREMLAQVQAPLLAVLQTSPDFRPAYEPLLHMAQALAAQDPAAARALLQALHAAQPARPEAGLALQRLSATRM